MVISDSDSEMVNLRVGITGDFQKIKTSAGIIVKGETVLVNTRAVKTAKKAHVYFGFFLY